MKEKSWGNTGLVLVLGDITKDDSQAIVNAANSRLAGGGGVDGAIHRAGGPAIMDECRKIGGCATGQAVITNAGRLKADKVIHTVGPIYSGKEGEAELLASCYENSLLLASQHGLKTIAFPSISTGAYGYPLEQAAQVALKTVKEFVHNHPDAFKEIRFVLFGPDAYQAYGNALKTIA